VDCELIAAIEVVSVSCAPSPQPHLHESEESDVQLDLTQGVPASDMLGDEENIPKIPSKCTVELPVEEKKL
jgi:hypothetical protein